MKSKGIIIGVVAIAFIAFAGIIAYFAMQGGVATSGVPTVATTTVVKQTNGITVSGTVESKETYSLYNPGTKGDVVKALVGVGDIVSKDDKLIEFDYGYLYAEEDGRILDINLDASSSSALTATTTATPSAMVTMGSKEYVILADVTEYDLANIPDSPKVSYVVRNNDLDKKYAAHLDRLPQMPQTPSAASATASSQITNYTLKVFLDDQPENILRDGYHVNVSITGENSESLTLASSAVINQDGVLSVFVVKDTNGVKTLEKRTIEATLKESNYIITSGLDGNEVIVNNPAADLTEGMEVNVQ
ncbi:hypothetical protein [Culicoidibacter larvae]|uniref:YknX-like beta-barrel domain-containing protein n=1 Tax=Culicoidibacter larvae TaxID=2579976 RepID=A0A5R8QD34_9FIRM|nr:hypothetical protein [Culicoidibacter larvae]TLG74254.1 hypothetical protein FEZ08_05985 [Culicoidibacter larvae]